MIFQTTILDTSDHRPVEMVVELETSHMGIFQFRIRQIISLNLSKELDELRSMEKDGDVVLLDYETNADVDNLKKPLSHASLIIAYLDDRWPL